MFLVLTMGIAISASLAMSRMRLTETITKVFIAGLRSATSISNAAEVHLRQLHREDGRGTCTHCSTPYPCPTIRVLDDPPPDPFLAQ